MATVALRQVAALVVGVLLLTAPVRAGDTPGNIFIQDAAEMFEGLIQSTEGAAEDIVGVTTMKIEQLVERGATDKQIISVGAKAIAKIEKLETKGINATANWGRKFNRMLAQWDEPDLIDQLTAIAAQRGGVLGELDIISSTAITAINDAVDAALAD